MVIVLQEKKIDRVLFSGAAVGLVSFGLKFVIFKENRLVRGDGLFLWQLLSTPELIIFAAPWIFTLVLVGFVRRDRGWYVPCGIMGNIALVFVFLFIGRSGIALRTPAHPFSRTSIGAGGWIFILASYIIISSSVKRIEGRRLLRIFISLCGIVALAILGISGVLDEISVFREYFTRSDRFVDELYRHLVLAGSAVLFAVFIGIPLGMLAYRRKVLDRPVFVFVNSVQTIPSLALFGLMIAPLAILSQRYPLLRQLGIKGVGGAPAIIALTLYALLPITRNTYTSLKVIDPSVVESARGMGMSRLELLVGIELPLSVPIVLGGVRISLVQAIGNTTVAALIGAGGFGVFVFQGLGQAVPDLILLGALPVIALAVVVDKLFELLIGVLTPRGIRSREAEVVQ